MNVQPITFDEAAKLVNNYHYLGKNKFMSVKRFGLFNDSLELIGAVVYQPLAAPQSAQSAFGLPRGNYPDLLEMARLVLNPTMNGKNYGSMLIGRSLKLLKREGIRAVISYADSTRHNGAIYQAANFGYYGLTAPKNDYLLPDGRPIQRGKTQGMGGHGCLDHESTVTFI